jgi:MoaA/NifB/PqqE/SkfB family radical SAM enzyme
MAIEYIGLETTNRCNYACVHCLRADIAPRKDLPPDLQHAIGPRNPRLDIPLEIVEKIIDEARPFNIPYVSFTGGEPTIHPQFKEIVRMFGEAGYQIMMVTNGTRFEKTYEAIRPYRDQLYGFYFSMDGATEKTMDAIREKNSFRRSLQAISVCKVKNLPFFMQMVITASNRHEIEDFALLASKLGARKATFGPVQPTLQTTYKQMNLPPQDWYEIKQQIVDLKRIYNVTITPAIGFPEESPWTKCDPLGMRALYIDYLGNLTFCCQLSDYGDGQVRTDIIANLAEVSLFDAYNKYVEMITSYQKEKLRRFKNSELAAGDAFPCWYCSKYFKKVDWMKKFPDDPWYEDAVSQNLAPHDRLLETLPNLHETPFVPVASVTFSGIREKQLV